MKKRFENQVVLITGASSGIGAATAQLFAREGAICVLVARSEAKLQEVAKQLQSIGARTLVIPADVADRSQLDFVVAQVMEKFGHIDVLFNNAGKSYTGNIDQTAFIEHLEEMIQVDFLGSVYATKAVLPIMLRQKHGHIINMSSVVGKKAFPKFTGYSSVMHAISGFTDGLRQELANTNIGVSIIHPALTQTPLLEKVSAADMPEPFKAMTPIPVGKVAHAVVEGVYHNKAKITVPFQPRFLFFLDAIAVRFGDWFIRLISKRVISKLLGMYQGKLYHELLEAEK